MVSEHPYFKINHLVPLRGGLRLGTRYKLSVDRNIRTGRKNCKNDPQNKIFIGVRAIKNSVFYLNKFRPGVMGLYKAV